MKALLTDARWLGTTVAAMLLMSGCASQPEPPAAGGVTDNPSTNSAPAPSTSGGGRYAMSGDAYPLEPPDVSKVPNAEPRIEPSSRAGNRSTYEVWGETYHVLPDATGYTKQGTASWYGEKFHGYATSNGEIYDMYKMSAAHRSLPLPTFARVTSLTSGQSVIVRVNDRGPFHSDREIDLSYAAAARLGFLDNGTGAVRVEAIDPQQWLAERGSGGAATPRAPTADRVEAADVATIAVDAPEAPAPTQAPSEPAADNAIYLQIAALENADSAQQLQQRLESELPRAVRVMSDTDVHRVQVGPVTPAQETQAREELRQAGFPQVFIVR